ncbi:hypothetical conserved protein [Candidatus Nitrosoglobus terrae]|uniref:Hypothetical conserved protein n=1 Tax=Candidatus Nitrosoglobus terrae TaxID=1630141 RepID=A0A1Q2SL20_9GAMM|nr:3D domain-containing protein [Candidatus Nitrosoglobus terrae]BAW79809.1 hypothetical conserved protein [Candidatus Nitrosoglobus terrae]
MTKKHSAILGILLLAVLLVANNSSAATNQSQSQSQKNKHKHKRKYKQHTLVVTSTAYTMRVEETKKGHVGLTAWGDQLKPGMKSLSVSRDLIRLGLDHGTQVRIEGLPSVYIVRDKMNKRWKKKIDIFMGNDVAATRKWGKRQVTIHWQSPLKK